jgi:hypothetical protein
MRKDQQEGIAPRDKDLLAPVARSRYNLVRPGLAPGEGQGFADHLQPRKRITMAHPGTIIFANPPGEAGWSFFYVVYQPEEDVYSVRCRPDTGEPLQLAGSAGQVVLDLAEQIAPMFPDDGVVPLLAAEQIRRHVAEG